MRDILQKNWWSLSLRGVLLLAFGALTVSTTGKNTSELIVYLAAMFICMAAIYIPVAILGHGKNKQWGTLLFIGILDLATGILCLINPERTYNYFEFIIGGWGALMGLFLLVMGLRAQKYKVLLILNGLVSIAFGILILVNPFEEEFNMNLVIGIYTIFLGVFVIYAGFRLKSLGRYIPIKETPDEYRGPEHGKV